MQFIYTLFILVVLFCVPLSEARAEQGPAQFFVSMQDMPLMPGLVELPDQAIVFDKPEGRIIESLVYADGLSFAEIRHYYESVLPQFGWSRIAQNAFERGDERLQMSFEGQEGESFLRMTVVPQ